MFFVAFATVMQLVDTLSGVATWYGPGFYDQPLYCDRSGELHFAEHVQTFVAIDRRTMIRMGWSCFDTVMIDFYEHDTQIHAAILDSGPLDDYYVVQPDASYIQIVVDVSEYAWPISLDIQSAKVKIIRTGGQ